MLKYTVISIIVSFHLMIAAFNVVAAEVPSDELLARSWHTLTTKNYSKKNKAIEIIAADTSPQVHVAMKAMLNGQLYFSRKSKELYILNKTDENYEFKSLFNDELIKQENKHGYKKVKINNRLRGLIKQKIAVIQLKHKDADIRFQAMQQLLKEPDAESVMLVESVIDQETDKKVKQAMRTFLAINKLEDNEESVQIKAIEILSDSLNPSAITALINYQPGNKQLKDKTQKAISKIESRKKIFSKVETIFFGLSLGSVLALSAIGLAITFGVMGVINMAHGELMMIGAYTTYVVQQLLPNNIGISILVAVPAAFIVAGLVGIAIERSIIRHLYGRPLETLLATFGVSLVLQQVVRSIFSPLNRSVETPQWMSGAWQFNEILAFTWNRFYIIIFCLMVFLALIFVMKKTSLGLQVRAVSQNRTMARAMGVKSEWVDALSFGLGSGIAGLAGVALSLLTNVGPNLGQAYIIDSFMVVVFGGVGNLWGTLIAGMSLGVFNKILEPWAGAVLAKILVLVFIILFIQKRPKGLFPQHGRAAED